MLPIAPTVAPDPFAGASWLTVPAPTAWMQEARWVWVGKAGDPNPTASGAPEGTVRLVQNWTLRDNPRSATIWFTADNRSRVWINGHSISRSSAWQRLERVDVRSVLKKGANRIEVEATNGPGAGTNPAGFLFAGEATFASGRPATLLSDQGWQSPDGSVVEIGRYDTAPWHLSREDVPCPVFRRGFKLDGKVKRAVARVIGLGQYNLFVNGQRQGDGFINGPWSQYDKTLYWQEFDLTKSLEKGSNMLGVELGNSFYRVAVPPPGRYSKGDVTSDFSHGAPYLLAMAVDIEYADGRRARVVTDKDWRWGASNYTFSHVYAGEDYDARRKGLAGKDWHEPKQVLAPKAELRKMDWPAFREVQSWKPTEILHPTPESWSYVFPQNAMAVLRFRVRGPRGATVKFRPSEVMTEDGEVRQLNLGGAEASGSYTLRGGTAESHEWRFFFHGFRYVEVTGAVPAGKPNPKGLPVLESLEMVHIRTDNPQVGAFHSSNRLFDRTHDLVDWAVRSNMAYVFSDCPTREKMGWLECAHLLFPTIAYRYDARAWFHKIARDIRDIQLPDGRITTVAPDYLRLPADSPYQFTVEWGAAGVLMPWQAYQWYGDRGFLTEGYTSMKRYVDWIDRHAVDGLAPAGLGDWYDYGHGQPPGPSRYTPTELTATAMWAICANAVAGAADALGEKADAARYRAMHARIKTAFLHHFYDPATKTLQNSGSVQSGHAMALYADLIPEEDRGAVLNAIVAELERRDYQQTPGDVGHRYFILALAEGGRSDVLHKVYNRTGVGSYGGILAKGLTTMPESWDALTVGGNSLNHAMLGHVQEWFYGWVLGIRQAPDSVGWKSILIAPEPGETTSAKGKTGTPQGPVSVAWKEDGNAFQIDATIPKGTHARIVVPFATRLIELDGQTFSAATGPFGHSSIDTGPGAHTVRAAREEFPY